jgi:REP element-mobilizing transposase RayT
MLRKTTHYSPDDKAQMPPEQVHFIIHLPAQMQAPPLVLRFKSPDTLGFFIEELAKYRREVWKDCEPVIGE